MMTGFANRKTPAHGVVSLAGQPTIVFDTVCTKDRRPWLASDGVHQTLRDVWIQADAWKVGRYVIMPDHIHLFAIETEKAIPYENWLRYWKSKFTKSISIKDFKWQSHHWDRRLRGEIQMEEKWQYILDNPVRKGLVESSEEWPYQGSIYHFSWT